MDAPLASAFAPISDNDSLILEHTFDFVNDKIACQAIP